MKKHLKIMASTIAGIMVISSGTVLTSAKTTAVSSESNCTVSCLTECAKGLPNCDYAKVLANSSSCNILNDLDIQSLIDDSNCAEVITVQLGNCTVTEPTECTTSTPTEPEVTEPVTETPSTEPTESTTGTVTVPEVTTPVVEAPTTEPTEQETSAPTEPTEPSDSSEYNEAYADEVIRLVNIEREKYGLPALSKRADATQAAEIRSKEITQLFSHTRPDGTSMSTVANELGISYKSIGENIAYGYSSPESVVNDWMNSDGHRKNILSSSFNGIGVGCYESNGILYWTQIFIGV